MALISLRHLRSVDRVDQPRGYTSRSRDPSPVKSHCCFIPIPDVANPLAEILAKHLACGDVCPLLVTLSEFVRAPIGWMARHLNGDLGEEVTDDTLLPRSPTTERRYDPAWRRDHPSGRRAVPGQFLLRHPAV